MNIQQAKQEIEYTVRAYLQKDDTGCYCFPALRQRPMLLMGPPGIGKTAIMEQIVQTLGIGLVSYTMTHHTRQSAIGLPQITEQQYGDSSFAVTRYTMSEIIASVYDTMAKTRCREGILFLDEINCVSDTLAPTMLQFLQNKTFGTHRLPEGWVIVAAGNPPEYNKSVREFDVVTLDRLRTIQVEPDTEAFLNYAAARNLHGAVLSFLRLNPQRFYHVSRKENTLFYVTARGWEDLSALLGSYEAMGIPISEEVIAQFLQLPETARAFYAYYTLYRKYGTDYSIPEILSDSLSAEEYKKRCTMAAAADPVERFAVAEMLLHGMRSICTRTQQQEELYAALHNALKTCMEQQTDLEVFVSRQREALVKKQQYGLLQPNDLQQQITLTEKLETILLELKQQRSAQSPECIRALFAEESAAHNDRIARVQTALNSGIRFLRNSMGDGQELTALLSGMTGSARIMRFIAEYGCPEFMSVCDRLQFRTAEDHLRKQCADAMR